MQTYRHDDSDKADLVSVSSLEEHLFLTEELNRVDPQHRRWYLSTRQDGKNQWINEGDGSQMLNLQEYFLQSNEWGELEAADYKKDYLVYAFSLNNRRWGFQPVFGHEDYLYICEVPIDEVRYLGGNEDRTAAYGQPLRDPRFISMGPSFVRQPNHTVFDLSRRKTVNDISLLCIARGWPTPTYEWYKEEYINDTLQEVPIRPLQDSRLTVSGGQLIINGPDQTRDKGTYFCTAENTQGDYKRKHKIRSKSVSLAFGFIGEFILRRSNEIGNENWGKAIKCDAPHHFPRVRYYWARDYFPNFVEEDRRIMVSHDGYIYFSALENIDRGNYSCNVQSGISSQGRNGPFFFIDVQPHPNHQQLRFPQNFPKSFPEAPVAGEEVRLECIAFGYPVPHYNWTRVNSQLPRGSYITNYNRVLIIPRVRVEDQGEYQCGAKNDHVHISAKITLSIQARPRFTIPIGDKFVDEHEEVIWTCEAFGIPDVTYDWLKNGVMLKPSERYILRENSNVLKILRVETRDEGMYQCRATNDLDVRYSSGQLKVLKLAPSFTKNPLEPKTYGARTGNVTLECKPEASRKQYNITWTHNGQRIGSGGKRIIYPSGSLQITKLDDTDAGRYACVATNEYGTARSSGILAVKGGPSFRGPQATSPNPQLVAFRGEEVQLQCAAQADDILDRAYYWRLNGFTLQYVEDYEEERLLELKNAGGSRVNSELDQFAFRRLRGGGGDLHTGLSSRSLYTTEEIRNKGTGDFQKFRRGIRDGYLTIDNITIADAGRYECVVETAVGRIIGSTNVIVHSPPGPPGGITAVNMGNTSCTVAWTDGAFYGLPITHYIIQGRTDHNQTWRVLADKVVGQEITYQGGRNRIDGRHQYRLEGGLTPWAAYSFRVAAYNSRPPGYPATALQQGEWSAASPQYNTRPGIPVRNVTNIRTGGGGRTGDLIVQWDPLPREYQNAPGIYYKLYYKRKGEISFKVVKSLRKLGNIGSHTIRIEPKYYWTEFMVQVQVFNDKCIDTEGCVGPMSAVQGVLSAEDLPQVAPTTVGARPHNSTAINVTWTPIPNVREKVRGKLIGHRIKYWRQDLDEVTESQYVLSRSTEPTALIIGLLPNTYYWVRVMAYNSAGPGPESERFLERTFKLRPQKPPTAVQVFGINPSTIKVTWRYVAPTVQEEPLTGYHIRVWESDKDISQANDTTVYIGTYNFKLEATISDLSPGKTYFLRVLAFSQGGEGKMSSPAWKFQMGDPARLNGAVGAGALLWPLLPAILPLLLARLF